ncbi:Alpha-xylosidase 1 [Linum grandiflorum]
MLTCTILPHCFSNVLHSLFLLLSFLHGVIITSSVPSKIGSGYRLISIQQTPDGALLGRLQVKHPNDIYGPDIPFLQLFVKHETEDRLRVHITDAEKQRWEVPYDLIPRQQPPARTATTTSNYNNLIMGVQDYSTSGGELIFSYEQDPFSFSVSRKSDGQILFDSKSEESGPFGPMSFKDQYLEISTKLPEEASASASSLYGLGESTRPSGIKLNPGESYTLYVSDATASEVNIGLCGAHPVYMDLRNLNGKAYAHGVLLLSSNGMDVFYRGSSLTYKAIGGVFDFYFFAGPTPLSVVDQYTSLIGRPAPMPYWAFGFHQSKWGYRNLTTVEDVVENYKKARIPLDVIWSDDDYMDLHKDFTLSPVNYPLQQLTSFLDKIHSIGMKYVVIVEPGISTNSTYGVLQRGFDNDVFLKHNGRPVLGQVWAGPVHFPDYLNPKTVSWWNDEIRAFLQKVPAVDGLWLDMNEPVTFCFGDCKSPEQSGRPCPANERFWECCLDCEAVTTTRWDDPPYKINVTGSQQPLGRFTVAASTVHYNGVLEYNAHNLYGLTQTIATHKALLDVRDTRRPFVLSRASFVGLGKYAAHWSGDNKATWDDLKYSITTMLNFGIFGVPMMGSDICGFYPAPTEELCNRWIELGAFYPFARDHSNVASPSQELYLWESVAESARNALGFRYKLLPYLYTLNYEAHTTGAPIARPLFFSFPNYSECYGLSTQFLLGGSVMVSPVLEEGKTQVNALFPPGSWYDMFNMSNVIKSKGEYHVLEAPLHVVNVHVYQNTILPMQQGGLISKDARMTPFNIVVTFPVGAREAKAKGNLFIDNDDLPEMKLGNGGESSYIEFHANLSYGWVKLWTEVEEGEYALSQGLVIEKVIVLGLDGRKGPLDLRFYGDDLSATTSKMHARSSEQIVVESGDGNSSGETTMVEVSGLEIPIAKKFCMVFHIGS